MKCDRSLCFLLFRNAITFKYGVSECLKAKECLRNLRAICVVINHFRYANSSVCVPDVITPSDHKPLFRKITAHVKGAINT
jgi:hypothetical protein